MYKNSLGYQRLDASVSGDLVTVGKLVITTYKDGDFSNCKRFDATGKCLSCSDS